MPILRITNKFLVILFGLLALTSTTRAQSPVFGASNPTDAVAFFNTINLNTVSSNASSVITPVAPITITRVEWSFGSIGVGCTTLPVVSVVIGGAAQTPTITMTSVNSKFQDFANVTINVTAAQVTANSVIQLRTTTAAAGCTTTPSNPAMIVHYRMPQF